MNFLFLIKAIFMRLFWTDEKFLRKKGVKIGEGCFISTRRIPSESYLIEIGDYVRIAPETQFFTHGGLWSLRKKYNDDSIDYFGKIKIGDYTYIGEGCKIMPGVSIGTNVIVGAGSILTKSVPDNSIVAGNPARIVGKTIDFYEKTKKINIKTKGLTHLEKKKYLLSLSDDMFISKAFLKKE